MLSQRRSRFKWHRVDEVNKKKKKENYESPRMLYY